MDDFDMKHIHVVLDEERVKSVTLYPKDDGMYAAMVNFKDRRPILVIAECLQELDVEILDKLEEVLY